MASTMALLAPPALAAPCSKASFTRVSASSFASARRSSLVAASRIPCARRARFTITRASAEEDENLGFKTMRKGVKEAANETVLSPRFYTTDFEEMETLFSAEMNPHLDMKQLDSILAEFRNDYNQTHFVRDDAFKKAADDVQGPERKIFVEFLERSCTAEFSGFLLYKELGRRLKKINPTVAEIFTLMSRDEARHAGFLNKAMSDFNLALDLGFLTKNRAYTFFKPKFIFYATYLSEKIGYWRYITIYRHLRDNPQYNWYPIFMKFENWCQDESRHGDFFTALLKTQPQFLNDWQSRLWARFFCLSVYITMYMNDVGQRSQFYENIGLDTRKFDMHVIIETNKTTQRIFPAVIDVENPKFQQHLDKLVDLQDAILAIGRTNDSDVVKTLKRVPYLLGVAGELLGLFFMKPVEGGSYDMMPNQAELVY
eukprot:jgi/Mesvir1/527/Mv11388-RA.1